MKYKIALFSGVFLLGFLFFYNCSFSKKLKNMQETVLYKETCKNKNLKRFCSNFEFFKKAIIKCSKYDYEYFSRFCLLLGDKNFITDLNITKIEKNSITDQYSNIFNNIFKIIRLDMDFTARKEEFITKFIDMLLSNDFFIYYVNDCTVYKSNDKYCAKLNIDILVLNCSLVPAFKNFTVITKKDYPLKIIDTQVCYNGLIKADGYERVYINHCDIKDCFSQNTKFSLTKCTDSFIILHINKLKKDLQLFFGKEGYIHP